MHEIKKHKKKVSYEGLHGKLIHLDSKTFDILSACAKLKNTNLKKYLETLAKQQALFEANEFIRIKKTSFNTLKIIA